MTVNLEGVLVSALSMGMSAIVMFIAWSMKRMISQYEKKIDDLSDMMIRMQTKLEVTVADLQKEVQQTRIDSALFKHTTGEISHHVDRITALEKEVILTNSRLSAAFDILTGKRKSWESGGDSQA